MLSKARCEIWRLSVHQLWKLGRAIPVQLKKKKIWLKFFIFKISYYLDSWKVQFRAWSTVTGLSLLLSAVFPWIGFILRFYHWLRESVRHPSWCQGAEWNNESTCISPPAVPADMPLTLIAFKCNIKPIPLASKTRCPEAPSQSYLSRISAPGSYSYWTFDLIS